MSHTFQINMSNTAEKLMLYESLDQLHGMYTIEVKENRRLRSNAQNRLYWAVYVKALQQYLLAQGEPKTLAPHAVVATGA